MDISSIASLSGIPSLSPAGSVSSLPSVSGLPSAGDGGTVSMFQDVYNGLIGNVNSTNDAFEGDIVKSAAGELDNPHQLVIDSTKANIALQLMLSVRNSALEAYNDIIKISV